MRRFPTGVESVQDIVYTSMGIWKWMALSEQGQTIVSHTFCFWGTWGALRYLRYLLDDWRNVRRRPRSAWNCSNGSVQSEKCHTALYPVPFVSPSSHIPPGTKLSSEDHLVRCVEATFPLPFRLGLRCPGGPSRTLQGRAGVSPMTSDHCGISPWTWRMSGR